MTAVLRKLSDGATALFKGKEKTLEDFDKLVKSSKTSVSDKYKHLATDNVQNDITGDTVLHLACRVPNAMAVAWGIQNGANSHIQNIKNETPLHTFLKYKGDNANGVMIVETLMSKMQTSDIDESDADGETPLTLAARRSHKLTALLLSYAPLDAEDQANLKELQAKLKEVQVEKKEMDDEISSLKEIVGAKREVKTKWENQHDKITDEEIPIIYEKVNFAGKKHKEVTEKLTVEEEKVKRAEGKLGDALVRRNSLSQQNRASGQFLSATESAVETQKKAKIIFDKKLKDLKGENREAKKEIEYLEEIKRLKDENIKLKEISDLKGENTTLEREIDIQNIRNRSLAIERELVDSWRSKRGSSRFDLESVEDYYSGSSRYHSRQSSGASSKEGSLKRLSTRKRSHSASSKGQTVSMLNIGSFRDSST